MIDTTDFDKKQIIVVFAIDGDKLAIANDNLIVKDKDGVVKLQTTCYRIFSIYIVGHTYITTTLINKTKQFGFSIALFSAGFRLYEVIGGLKNGNTLLHRKQYQNETYDIGKYIIKNKILSQRNNIMLIRNKQPYHIQCVENIDDYLLQLDNINDLQKIMGIEGLVAKEYFKAFFDNINWQGRKPRIKQDYINSILDIGYTVLFEFIDAILCIYGFDTYCGMLHRQFYMRKSLTCDIVEPFRCIIDYQTKKSINLNQFKKEDFIIKNNQYQLEWKYSKTYVKVFLEAILKEKKQIFVFIQQFYRSFMKDKSVNEYPVYRGIYVNN